MPRSPDQSVRWPPDRRPLTLRPDDFDANRSGRALADLRRRMNRWAAGVVTRLAELGVDATAHAVDERASVQVQFTPRGMARNQASQSARLVLGIDDRRVRAGLEVPAPKTRAVRARLADPARALEVATALGALPEQFTIGDSSDLVMLEAPRATPDDLRALLDRSGRAPQSVWLGWTVPREVALQHATLLDEQLEDAIAALAQLFAILVVDAAVEADDGADCRVRRVRRVRRVSGRRNVGKGNVRVDEERDNPRSRDGDERGRSRSRERDAEGELEIDVHAESAHQAGPAAPRRAEMKPPRRQGSVAPARTAKGSPSRIEPGARVSVLKGPFLGKVGIVHDMDGKGSARVMMGLLAVRLEVQNLMLCASGRRRPVLSSSHRKPIPTRS